MNAILVTGASGNIGHRVVQELQARSVPVRAFARDREKAMTLLGPETDIVQGDFGDPSSIQCALEGVDVLLLSCGNDPRQVEYEANVIDAAAEAGVRKLVKLSTIGARPGAPTAFWDSHGQAEEYLRESRVPSVILQSSFYMSNLLGNAESIRQMGKLFAPAGGASVSMIDPRDVAEVAAIVLSSDGHEGQTYVLTGPEAITFGDVAGAIGNATGRGAEFVDVPDEAAREGLIQSGMPDWVVDQVIIVFRLLREGAVSLTTSTVEQLTGHPPRDINCFARGHAHLFGR